MLSNTRLKAEITRAKTAISELKEIIVKSKDGIEVNEIVIKGFESELEKKE